MDQFEPYRKQIGVALRELMKWADTKKKADQEMSKLRHLIIANANMLPDNERAVFIAQASESFAGFTDSIREVFRTTYPKGLTPIQLRHRLVSIGFDLDAQSNPMASIHSVIRRLLTAGEIEPNGDVDMGGYRWKQVAANAYSALFGGSSTEPDNQPRQRLGTPNPTNTQKK
jgi:hypothetical protein